ncbi:MAG: hypothetical protein KDJ52_13525 [Anaerolineae bacterium]|nr:hypothetical protein [Anaerolineae bacterium]
MPKRNLKLIRQRGPQLPKHEHVFSKHPIPNFPLALTPAEYIEGARFKVLTIKRAARQAKVRQMIARLHDIDNAAA